MKTPGSELCFRINIRQPLVSDFLKSQQSLNCNCDIHMLRKLKVFAEFIWQLGFPCGSAAKRIHLQWGRPGFDPWVGKIPWRTIWQPTPVFLPGESHGRKEPGRLQSTGSQRVGHDWATSLSLFLSSIKSLNEVGSQFGGRKLEEQWARGHDLVR